jgi:hypothetical protein
MISDAVMPWLLSTPHRAHLRGSTEADRESEGCPLSISLFKVVAAKQRYHDAQQTWQRELAIYCARLAEVIRHNFYKGQSWWLAREI